MSTAVAPPLPGEIWAEIFSFLREFTFEDALNLRSVCKEFDRVISLLLKLKLAEYETGLADYYLDIKDPISILHLYRIPLCRPYTSAECSRICELDIKNIITFKNLSEKQLDRLLGFMIENFDTYAKYFSEITRIDNFTLIAAPVSKDKLITDIIDRYGKSDLYRKAFYLVERHDQFDPMATIRYPGVSDYYEAYASASKWLFTNEKIKLNHLNLLLFQRSFFDNRELKFRIMHGIIYTYFSDIVDIILSLWTLNLTFAQVHQLSPALITTAYILFALFSWLFLSPSWIIFRKMELYSYQHWFEKHRILFMTIFQWCYVFSHLVILVISPALFVYALFCLSPVCCFCFAFAPFLHGSFIVFETIAYFVYDEVSGTELQ